jgi:16S rRNA (uracil1498-N3)-methyltransferase
VPVIEAPVLFADFLKSDVLKFNPLKLVASLRGRNPYLLELLQTEKKSYESIICLIGPEGDLSEAEHQGALKGAFMPVRLSANVLRSDTAALYLLTLLDQWIIA